MGYQPYTEQPEPERVEMSVGEIEEKMGMESGTLRIKKGEER